MEGKAKAAAIAAAVALAAGLALSAGSCAMRQQPAEDAGQQPAAAEQIAEENGGATEDGEGAARQGATAFERAAAIDWRAEGGARLQLSRGMVVERDAKGALHVTTVSDVREEDAGDQAIISIEGTDEEEHAPASLTLVLDESGGAATLSCDGLKAAKAYIEDISEKSIAVAGLDEAYLGLVGGDAEPLRRALAAFMRESLPQASSASFDGEAFVDFNDGSVRAAFHADDPARTVLAVTYSDGTFTVSR